MVMKGGDTNRIRMAIELSPKNKSYATEKEKFREPLNNSKIYSRGYKSRDGSRATKVDVERKGERKQSLGDKQSRLAKVEEIKLKGDFEQRRSRWDTAENKAACSECVTTDHFKAQCPIWIK